VNTLLIKCILMPVVIAFVTFASKKWGNSIGGMLASMPWVAGPIILFIALEQGKTFATNSIPGVLVGIIGWLAFCISYILVGKKYNAIISLFAGYLVYFLTGIMLNPVISKFNIFQWLFICFFLLFLGLRFFPKVENKNEGFKRTLRFEILLRMLVITSFVILITYFAKILGPNWSGILTPFPIMTAVLAIFIHYTQGIFQVRKTFMGLFSGIIGFTLFLFLQAILMPVTSLLVSFSLGLLVNVAVTLSMKQIFEKLGLL